jgi:hypothetical protein
LSEEARLPAHVEVSGLIRRVAADGGFAAVLQKGEREAGTILLVWRESGANPRLFERMPTLDGPRRWTETRVEDPENPAEFDDYVSRRGTRDADVWIVELDVPNPERFIPRAGNPA